MKRKHYLSGGLAGMVLSVALGSQIFAAGAGFSDLNDISGADKIASLQEQHLIKGVDAVTFSPSAALTNAEGIQIIANVLASVPEVKEDGAAQEASEFSNIKNDAWFVQAFHAVSDQGIAIPGDIDPGRTITREEYTSYLVQAMEKIGNLPMINLIPKEIADESLITPEYQGAIQRSLVWGINELDSENHFNPQEKLTRAEAAVMLYQALEYVKSHPYDQVK